MITPHILGSGRAGHAIAKSLAALALQEPELEIAPALWIPRGSALASFASGKPNAVLVIANPHALHAKSIVEGERAGFRCIFSEKPSCVNEADAASLKGVRATVGVFHVYRQMWGVQQLRKLVEEGALGQVISIEGRYWQASSAERAVSGGGPTKSWKNDPELSGPSDALLDVGTHWIDAAAFVMGALPVKITGWRSYANAEASHRDTHLQVAMDFDGGGRALGSISKTAHGATNRFELVVLGTRKSAAWNFLEPDELFLGEGRDRQVVTRKNADLGSCQPAFHAMGWVEGYIEILHQALGEAFLGRPGNYPKLSENLKLMECLFHSELWKAGGRPGTQP